MGQFVVSTKSEANAMTYAKLLHKYKEVTDEPFGEAVLFLAQKLADEADPQLVKKLTDKTFSFRDSETKNKPEKVKADTCPLFSETDKQNKFSEACKDKGLDENNLKNAFLDFVIDASKTEFEAELLNNFFFDFVNREDKSQIEEYKKICETEEVTIEQTFRALIERTVETGRFPFLFNKDEYINYEDVLKQLAEESKSGHVSALGSDDEDTGA